MIESELLNLSVGDRVTRSVFSSGAFTGSVTLQDRQVEIFLSAAAVDAASEASKPILAQMELYFSCLVRKQVRFMELDLANPDIVADRASIIPGLFTSFRAICTQHCNIADFVGKPPVETMPVKKRGMFMPDWIRIDYRAGEWLGEYGFARNR
ncbi:MAG TPA: hypothetical protein ENJ80_01590 [Gammaproteobacteria bacterium]|nr:hypothetical protein [Gammaproteobacteria bacterium]